MKMEFKKYQHIERFGTTEVENIELGECYIFSKLDGTNASVWRDNDGNIKAASRRRQLTLESDNAGFYAWVKKQDNLIKYLERFPTHRLYGEWLVPHSLKTYKETAWKRFYIFDVALDKEDGTVEYINYEKYAPGLDEYEIDYIIPIIKIVNPSYDQLINQLNKNNFLIEEGKGLGEGIVIKNYNFRNKYGRQIWAKIVTSEFKEKHTKTMGVTEAKGKKLIEEEIAKEFTTKALIEKVYNKMKNENGFTSKNIPQLLNTVYYDVVKEDCWTFIKKHKNPTINFKKLQHLIFKEVKEKFSHLF